MSKRSTRLAPLGGVMRLPLARRSCRGGGGDDREWVRVGSGEEEERERGGGEEGKGERGGGEEDRGERGGE